MSRRGQARDQAKEMVRGSSAGDEEMNMSYKDREKVYLKGEGGVWSFW